MAFFSARDTCDEGVCLRIVHRDRSSTQVQLIKDGVFVSGHCPLPKSWHFRFCSWNEGLDRDDPDVQVISSYSGWGARRDQKGTWRHSCLQGSRSLSTHQGPLCSVIYVLRWITQLSPYFHHMYANLRPERHAVSLSLHPSLTGREPAGHYAVSLLTCREPSSALRCAFDSLSY